MKRIVLCCDGTWSRADNQRAGKASPTNVVRAAYLTAKTVAGNPQVILYDEGVGTGNVVDKVTGGAFGKGLDLNIFEAYRFLVANFEPGDELFLFGFSRGAFTVRSIAGMIRKCGILRRGSVDQYRSALAMYRNDEHPDDEGPALFRKKNSIAGDGEIPITFIGVWDTVGALGIPLRGLRRLTARKHQFHDTELSKTVKNAFQALAIDERRTPFEPTLWHYKPKPDQVVEQVWFPGVHSDVGGGYVERGLSDIALEWLLGRARDVGLAFDADALEAYPIKPDPMGKMHDSRALIFRLPGLGEDRVIGLTRDGRPDPTQSVHLSALARWDGDGRYRPRSLRAHFKRTGDARAEA